MKIMRRTRLRHGPSPLLRRHHAFLRRVVTQPKCLRQAGVSQLRAIQEVLQNVNMGNIPIPTKLIKGTPWHQIGKGLSSLCHYIMHLRRIKTILAGNRQRGGFPLAALAKFAIPQVLKQFTAKKKQKQI